MVVQNSYGITVDMGGGKRTVTSSDLVKMIANPVIYAETVLGVKLWYKQQEILMEAMHEPLTVVKACHGSGKTFMLAVFILWWMTRYKYTAKVVTLAPTERQVRSVLWSEINGLYENSKLAQALLDNVPCSATQLVVTPTSFARGVSGSTTTSLQGYHAENLLICIDEGPGVQYEFFEALHGARAGGNVTLIMMGNPTINSGLFYEAFTRPEMGWRCFTISGFDSPNVISVEIPEEFTKIKEFPGVDDPHQRRLLTYLLELEKKDDPIIDEDVFPIIFRRRNLPEYWYLWGVNNESSWYSRALGQFAPEGADALLRMEWLNAANTDEEYFSNGQPLVLGLDVAAQGDDVTVLTGIQGGRMVFCEGWADQNPYHKVLNTIVKYADNIYSIHVDIVGTGYHFAIRLAEDLAVNYPHIQVVGVNVGVRATDGQRYVNLRSDIFWNLREIFERGQISGINHPTLRTELTSLRWEENERGQIALEPKKEMKKRGLTSPDYADSLALALWPAQMFAEQNMYLGEDGEV